MALLLARILGPSQFGVYALLWPIINLTLGVHWALITSPMQSAVVEAAPQDLGLLFNALLPHALAIGVVGGMIVATTVIWFAPHHSSVPTALVAAAMTLAVVLQEFARRWLLAAVGAAAAVVSDACRHVGIIAALAWITHTGKTGDLQECLEIMTCACVAALIPLLARLLQFRWHWSGVKSHAHRHGATGRWLLASVGIQSLATAAPVYALGTTVGVNAAGGFRAALNLLSPVVSLTEALETFLPMRCHRAFKQGGSSKARAALMAIGLPGMLLIACFTLAVHIQGNWLLSHLFGKAYEGFSAVLLPLTVAMVLQFLVYLVNVYRRAAHQTKIIFLADVASLLTLVSLALFAHTPDATVVIAWAVALSQLVKLITLIWHPQSNAHRP